MNEITFEITNYCEHECKFCSSNSTYDMSKAKFMKIETIQNVLKNLIPGRLLDHIIISGGEPLAHPDFYKIFKTCHAYTKDVIVYSNLITHLVYNLHAIDGVYLEAKITPTPETKKISVLKRVCQGREAERPEVTFSRNYYHVQCECCDNMVVKPDGTISPTPCRKD